MRGKRLMPWLRRATALSVLYACGGASEPPRASPSSNRGVVDVAEAEGAASGDAVDVRVYLRRDCTESAGPTPCGRRPAGANVPVKVIFFDASEATGLTDGTGRALIQLTAPLAAVSLQAGKADLVVQGVRAGSVDLSGLSQANAWQARQVAEADAAKAAQAQKHAAEAADRSYKAVAVPCSTATTLDECAPLVRWLGEFGSKPENAERVRDAMGVLQVGLPRGVDDTLNKLDLACTLVPSKCAELAGSVVELLRYPISESLIPDIPARLARIQRAVAKANLAARAVASSRRTTREGPTTATWQPPSFGSPSPSNDDSEERHQREMRDLQARHDRESRESERRAADARDQEARRAQEDRQRAESERRSREQQEREQQRRREEAANRAAFECFSACSKAHLACRIGNGPDYNKSCLSQVEASHNACCVGAGKRSAWPTCSCSER